jgi:hypothetical protein
MVQAAQAAKVILVPVALLLVMVAQVVGMAAKLRVKLVELVELMWDAVVVQAEQAVAQLILALLPVEVAVELVGIAEQVGQEQRTLAHLTFLVVLDLVALVAVVEHIVDTLVVVAESASVVLDVVELAVLSIMNLVMEFVCPLPEPVVQVAVVVEMDTHIADRQQHNLEPVVDMVVVGVA